MSAVLRSGLLVALLMAALAPALAEAGAVQTSGTATLTMCRDWLVYDSCSTYHNIAVPPVIAVGDAVRVHFGSSPKSYDFHVVGIHRHGEGCTLLSDHTGKDESGEKLRLDTCPPAAKPAAR